MSGYNTFTTMASASCSQAAMTPSAPTTSIMTNARILRNSDARATSTLTGAANAITRFLIEGAQLPKLLSHYAGFFAGFLTGALGGTALYAYLHRNQCDRAKVKLAVFHILHVIQHGPDYDLMLQNPQALLQHIEAEVMRLVDVHLTKNEATQVTKEVKRNYARIASEEQVHKRVREDVRDVVKERMGPYLAPAYEHSPRGFLQTPVTEQPYRGYEPAPPSPCAFNTVERSPFPTPEVTRYDTPVQLDTAFVRRELGLTDGRMDIDQAAASYPHRAPASSYIKQVPCHLFGGTARPPSRLPATSFAQQSIFIGRANASTPSFAEKEDGYEAEVDFTASPEPADSAARATDGLQGAEKEQGKKREGYGLDYEDDDIYSSDSSSDDEDLPPSCPPTVVRQLQGRKCSGTQLSPIPGSPSINDGSRGPLPFAHWSTTAELVYSSSESEGEAGAPRLPGATTPPPQSPEASPESPVAGVLVQGDSDLETVEEVGEPQIAEPEVEQENFVPSSPSRKRKSPSSSPSSPAKRARSSSPLADVTNGPYNTPSPRPIISPSPNKKPFKAGRGRGRTGPGPVVRSSAPAPVPAQSAVRVTRKKQKANKVVKTPATRKSSRLAAKSKKNE